MADPQSLVCEGAQAGRTQTETSLVAGLEAWAAVERAFQFSADELRIEDLLETDRMLGAEIESLQARTRSIEARFNPLTNEIERRKRLLGGGGASPTRSPLDFVGLLVDSWRLSDLRDRLAEAQGYAEELEKLQGQQAALLRARREVRREIRARSAAELAQGGNSALAARLMPFCLEPPSAVRPYISHLSRIRAETDPDVLEAYSAEALDAVDRATAALDDVRARSSAWRSLATHPEWTPGRVDEPARQLADLEAREMAWLEARRLAETDLDAVEARRGPD